MNLYCRLIWLMVRSIFKPNVAFGDQIVLDLRILPNDLDINRHLNNGRYLTLLDLGSIDLFLRSGILKQCIRNGIRPMIGGVLISYRRGLALFEKCRLTMQLSAWDERWNYFRFEFCKSDGSVAAAGYFKGALVSPSGLIPTGEADKTFGYHRESCLLPPAIRAWIESETSLLDNIIMA